MGNSIRELIDMHGVNIKVIPVDDNNQPLHGYPVTTILEDHGNTATVEYSSGKRGTVLTQYKGCNDYMLYR